jgi:DNA polymerase-3 subunit delta
MILFIHGEDTYTSHKKLLEIQLRFIEKNSDFNLQVIDGDTVTDLGTFKKYTQTLPLFGDKSCIIFKNLLSESKNPPLLKQISEFLASSEQTNIVVFYESYNTFDRRTSLYKFLASQKFSQEYKLPTGYNMDRWVVNEANNLGLTLTNEAKNELTYQVSNLWQLRNELHKLALYKDGQEGSVTLQDIKENVSGTIQSNVFKMIDYIGLKKTKDAINELENLIKNGENEIKILSMITYQVRILVQARDTLNQGKSKEDLIKRANLKPFVATKSIGQAKNFTLDELKKIYGALVETDHLIKTSTADPHLALNRLLIEICI